MMRNDYRRSLILLRSNVPGISGHVRLERRTLTGSMYFMLQVPGTGISLRAALAGRDRTGYYACDLGQLKLDGRGQATLGYSFDPRNICGRELEQYQLIVVARNDGNCEILLSGNVCGYADVSWERVREAVCALYSRDEAPPVPIIPSVPRPDYQGPPPRPFPSEPALPEDNQPDYQGPPPRPFPTEPALPEDNRPDNQEPPPRPFPTETALPEENLQPPETEVLPGDPAQPSAVAAGSFAQAQPTPVQTAAELLNLDMNLPWPEETQALKPLFKQQPPLQNAPQDNFIYVEAPLPEGSGYPYCAAGIRVENGAPAAVRYALPSPWTDQPPAGLEDALWLGDNNAGWWVRELPIGK